MFSWESASSISLATVTPSLVTVGEPKDFSRTTFRPDGPSVTFTARASLATPRRMASRASMSNAIFLAAMSFLLDIQSDSPRRHGGTEKRIDLVQLDPLLCVYLSVSLCLCG